ncbi:uncharacterized protein LOC125149353 [Prionailurus viverrinus]|uniref:uncharacterized protein LOC125149353 n=1 Tax=Prionailurus viverrinus TaxID=61388 RepID=UPI001FF6317A|nr:uncharacterized protein LOC125149353 [Prionailurus viverrinus]
MGRLELKGHVGSCSGKKENRPDSNPPTYLTDSSRLRGLPDTGAKPSPVSHWPRELCPPLPASLSSAKRESDLTKPLCEGLHPGDRKGGIRDRGSSQTKGELVSRGRRTASHPGQERGRPPTGGVGRSSRPPGPHPEHGPALSLLHDFLPLLLPGTLGTLSVLRVQMRFKETHPLARDHAARKPQRWDSAPGPCNYKGPPSTCVGFAATGNRLCWISHGWRGSREGLEVIGCGVG